VTAGSGETGEVPRTDRPRGRRLGLWKKWRRPTRIRIRLGWWRGTEDRPLTRRQRPV